MWRNLLKSDANVDLVHFTILRPPEKGADGTPINELSLIAFPVADLFGPKIKDFDLIIFDRYSSSRSCRDVYLDNIANYVRDGGALLMAEGPDFCDAGGPVLFTARRDRAGRADRRRRSRRRSDRRVSHDGPEHPGDARPRRAATPKTARRRGAAGSGRSAARTTTGVRP